MAHFTQSPSGSLVPRIQYYDRRSRQLIPTPTVIPFTNFQVPPTPNSAAHFMQPASGSLVPRIQYNIPRAGQLPVSTVIPFTNFQVPPATHSMEISPASQQGGLPALTPNQPAEELKTGVTKTWTEGKLLLITGALYREDASLAQAHLKDMIGSARLNPKITVQIIYRMWGYSIFFTDILELIGQIENHNPRFLTDLILIIKATMVIRQKNPIDGFALANALCLKENFNFDRLFEYLCLVCNQEGSGIDRHTSRDEILSSRSQSAIFYLKGCRDHLKNRNLNEAQVCLQKAVDHITQGLAVQPNYSLLCKLYKTAEQRQIQLRMSVLQLLNPLYLT
jgi:hypothetical protein